MYRARWTIAFGGTGASSRCSQRGSSGVSTCVSTPSSGRCVASLSGRWTPPPPAGGKYIETTRTFTRLQTVEGVRGVRPHERLVDLEARAPAVHDQPAGAVAGGDVVVARPEELLDVAPARVRPVLVRVRDVAGRRGGGVDPRVKRDPVGRLQVRGGPRALGDVGVERADEAR